jgi:isoleucyl-tRNA synthetase
VAPSQWHQPELAAKWQALQRVRDDVNKALEVARNARAIGAPLEAKVVLTCSDPTLKEHLVSLGDRLHYLFITSQAVVAETLPESPYQTVGEGIQVAVVTAEGTKCVRCWHYSPKVGDSTEHPHLCERCTAAIAGLEFA